MRAIRSIAINWLIFMAIFLICMAIWIGRSFFTLQTLLIVGIGFCPVAVLQWVRSEISPKISRRLWASKKTEKVE